MIETGFGLFCGSVLGLCVGPLWMMLQLPMRTCDIFHAGNMHLCAWALALGASAGALSPVGFLPEYVGVIFILAGGIFTGMIASALVEAVEVVPVLYDRLSISVNMQYAALALALGKGAGALFAGIYLGV